MPRQELDFADEAVFGGPGRFAEVLSRILGVEGTDDLDGGPG